MAVPTATYLNIARVSQYLSADGNSKNLLFKGTSTRPAQTTLLNIVRDSVQWLLDTDPDSDELPLQANYMYSLCNPYVAAANAIINSGATGNIVNPSTGQNVTVQTPFVQFRVGDVGAPMTAGETSLTLSYTGVVNPSVEITLDGTEVPYDDPNQISYTATYNPTNVQVVFNQGVQNGQLYIIHMIQLVAV